MQGQALICAKIYIAIFKTKFLTVVYIIIAPTYVLNFCLDVWSAGCVLAELMLGQPIFPGDSGVDQLVEIIKVLGTPTKEQIREMNRNYTEFRFPQIKAHPWQKVILFTFSWLLSCNCIVCR